MKPKTNLYKLLGALLICVILAGLLITALTDRNEALTAGWTKCGTCEWKIDDGVLTIRPLGDGIKGTLEDWSPDISPWTNNSGITSVVVKSGVKAATCRRMFEGCEALTSLDLSSFDTSQVTDMRSMFEDCVTLTSLDLSSLDTSQVTDMRSMFSGCEALTFLDLSSFDTSQVTDMRLMFGTCPALKELTLGANFNFKGNSMLPDRGMWANGAWSLTASQLMEQYNGSTMVGTWVLNVLTAGWTKCGTCEWKIDDGVLTIRPLGDGSEGTLEDWGFQASPWENNTNITSVVVKSGVKAATCYGMFNGCWNLTFLDLSSFDTSQVTDMEDMFDDCFALTSLDLSSFDTSQVTDMYEMFADCRALTSLDLSSFDTNQVTDMSAMFFGCFALTSLDLSSFDTSQVTDMSAMFEECFALTSLDLSSFDTSQVTDMSETFCGCFALTSLDLSSFDTSQVTDMSEMFCGCFALTSLDLSSFDTGEVKDMSWMFDACNALKELTLGANFNFNSDSCLTDPSNIAPYTGKWANGGLSLTAGQLTEQYNGSAMAGTWVWETE